MKRTLLLSVCLLCAFACLWLVGCGQATPPAQNDPNDAAYTFTLTQDGTYAITAFHYTQYQGASDTLNVPATHNGKAVTAIGKNGLTGAVGFKKIVLPEGITSIGESAFSGCIDVEEVVIPPSVKTIGYLAFASLTNLKTVTGGVGIVEIDGFAFSQCRALSSFTLPEGLTKVGKSAFYYCLSLNVTRPSTLTDTGLFAFYGCGEQPALEYGEVEGGLTVLGQNPYYTGERIDIPDDVDGVPVVKVELGAFQQRNENIRFVTVGNNVTDLGAGAFTSCVNLEEVTLGSGITALPDSLFYGCTSLRSVTFSGQITAIGAGAFARCYSLVTFTVPDTVRTIGQEAFMYCKALSHISLGTGLTELGSGAFYECRALACINNHSALTLTKGDSSYGNVAQYARLIYTGAFNGDYVRQTPDGFLLFTYAGQTVLLRYMGEEELVRIPSGVNVIARVAFDSNTAMREVLMPASVETVEAYAFVECTSLQTMYCEVPDIKDWHDVTVQQGNMALQETDKLYYSATEPPEDEFRQYYWCYGEGDEIVLWLDIPKA